MSGFDNDTVYANNADFSRAGAGGGRAANGLQLNGQLWIGSTNVNAGGTHVNVGYITSLSGSLTVSNNAGGIDISIAGGTTTIQTITGDSGGALSPTAGNINTLGSGSITIAGSGSTLTTQLQGLTNHAILVGAGTTTIGKILTTATAGQVLQSSGAAADPAYSTATYPTTATSPGTILRADGTNWVATTATYPATTTISQLLYSSANNVVGGLSTANNGTLVTSATGVPSILAGPGTSGNILQSNAAAAPSFSNATYPVSTTINQVLYSSSANVVGGITAANNGTMISGNTGIPSWLANGTTGQLLTATTGSPPSWVSPATSGTVTTVSVVSANGLAGTVANASSTPAITLSTTITGVLSGNGTAISGSPVTQHGVLVGGASNAVSSTSVGSTGQVLQANSAADPTYSTATFPSTATGTGTILRADGTNWVSTTATYPATTTINQVLFSSSSNVVGGITAANNGTLISGTTGIPSWLANGTTGQLLTATTGSPPSWVSPATAGTVTTVSVATANGFAGTVANASSTPAITLTTSQTGLLSGNGTAITGTAITQYNVITGGASNAPNSVAPSATSGVPLISQGSASQPVFGTALVAGGGTGFTSATAYAVICGGTTTTGAFQPLAALGASGTVLTSNGASALPSFQAAASGGISTVTGQIFTASGAFTYTPTASMKYVICELVGGGAGGGGCSGAGIAAGASGGGSGGYCRFILTAAQVGSSLTGSVGAGGAGGASGANNGTAGGNTTLATTSAWTSAGGAAGIAGASDSAKAATSGGAITAGTGTVLVSTTGGGGGCGMGFALNGNLLVALGGAGGSNRLGSGGSTSFGLSSTSVTGQAGVGYGAGGAGASVCVNAAAGGTGITGVAIFTEFV